MKIDMLEPDTGVVVDHCNCIKYPGCAFNVINLLCDLQAQLQNLGLWNQEDDQSCHYSFPNSF